MGHHYVSFIYSRVCLTYISELILMTIRTYRWQRISHWQLIAGRICHVEPCHLRLVDEGQRGRNVLQSVVIYLLIDSAEYLLIKNLFAMSIHDIKHCHTLSCAVVSLWQCDWGDSYGGQRCCSSICECAPLYVHITFTPWTLPVCIHLYGPMRRKAQKYGVQALNIFCVK